MPGFVTPDLLLYFKYMQLFNSSVNRVECFFCCYNLLTCKMVSSIGLLTSMDTEDLLAGVELS
jgi:hypothetical protein